jgi:heat shock protein HslJ
MKGSLLASGLMFGTLASSVVANPLEARAFGLPTITKTVTATQTNTVTSYKAKTRTVTETETEIINRTKTKTVVSSTTLTVNHPTTVTKTSTRNVPGPTTTKTIVSSSTVVVDRPTTVYKTSTAVMTTSLPPTTVVSNKTILSTKTLPVSVSTQVLPGSTITSTRFLPASTFVSTKTLPVSVSTKTLPASVSTQVIPASTIVSTKVLPASTIVSTKSVQVTGPTVTQITTIKGSTVFAPAQTVTSFSTKEISGPTITDLSIATITAVSTAYINNGTCGSPSSIDGRNMTTSAPPFPTLASTTSLDNLNMTASATSTFDDSSMTTTATSSSAATSLAVGNYANVKTATCDSAPAYYIQVNNSGTRVDGTVLCNQGGPSSSGSWMYMYPPASAQALASLGVGPMIPQPFTFDQETGKLVSYWNSDSLTAYITQDTRAGLVYSGSPRSDPPLTCSLQGSTLVNCGSKFTGTFQLGVRVEGSGDQLHMLRVAGGTDYNSGNDHDAAFTLIPACDLNPGGSALSSTASSSMPTTASSTYSSAAATSTAPAYANVITTSCDNPKGYYIEISDSGTSVDGTVMCNGYAGSTGNWMYYEPPLDLETLGGQAPQPFNLNSSDGTLVTTWSSGESLSIAGSNLIYSGPSDSPPKLICSLDGDRLVGCHSSETPSQVGLRYITDNKESGGGYLRVAGTDDYNQDDAYDATFRLIPACDYKEY